MSNSISKFCKLNLLVKMRGKWTEMGQNALKGLKKTEIEANGKFKNSANSIP